MSSNVLVIFLGWLIALAFFFGFIVLLRYLHHRERMALIKSGIDPNNVLANSRQHRSRGVLRAGLITGMVGLSLTIGLYPIGFLLPATFTATPFHLGPWPLPGLIPLGVGIALICSYYLEQNSQAPNEPEKADEKKAKITFIEEQDKGRREQQ